VAVTVQDLRRYKETGERFVMLTAYDCLLATIFDQAGVPLILVGDTLGIFALGYETTVPVTMDDVVHHTRAVTRAVRESLVVGDLPLGSYEAEPADGLRNAMRLVKEGGAAMVKYEGPDPRVAELIAAAGVPVMGHLGLTPQSVHAFGGHRVQARTRTAVDLLVEQARQLEAAGIAALVLEAVPSAAAKEVTSALGIPTIGIGAGPDCDGQVLVGPEMLGMFAGHRPRFAKHYAQLARIAGTAAQAFKDDVAAGRYPDPEHSYNWEIKTG
jgi:3-methyl-2-oxobutanoate hydroxymethyltransferase